MVLFAQNKKLPPHYVVNRKPISAVARALQTTGLLLYFGGQQKIPFWTSESANGAGVSLLQQEDRKVSAREEFGFSPHTAELDTSQKKEDLPETGVQVRRAAPQT